MTAQRKPAVDTRDPLSRELVLRAAVELADEEGIEALTMRRLAQRLGVEAMTLYYHAGKKDKILDGMVDLVVQEMGLPESSAEWKPALRRAAISAHEVLLRHHWAAALMLSPSRISRARLDHMDAILGTLRRGGFSADLTDHAYHALESHIMGFTLWLVGMNLGSDEDVRALGAAFLETLPRDELPHLAEHIEQHLKPRGSADDGEFEFGLDLILDGLERMSRRRRSIRV